MGYPIARSRSKKRDLTEQQFLAALEREGFGKPQAMGYCDLGLPDRKVSCSIWNAGSRRRDQLAYLQQMRRRERNKVAL